MFILTFILTFIIQYNDQHDDDHHHHHHHHHQSPATSHHHQYHHHHQSPITNTMSFITNTTTTRLVLRSLQRKMPSKRSQGWTLIITHINHSDHTTYQPFWSYHISYHIPQWDRNTYQPLNGTGHCDDCVDHINHKMATIIRQNCLNSLEGSATTGLKCHSSSRCSLERNGGSLFIIISAVTFNSMHNHYFSNQHFFLSWIYSWWRTLCTQVQGALEENWPKGATC